MNLLIGSRALNFWFPDHKIKEDTDWDIISNEPIEGAEFHDRKFLNNNEFEKFTNSDDYFYFNDKKIHVVNLFGLAIIKRSHLWRNLSFDKHITQYEKYLKQFNVAYLDNYQILEDRIRLTMEAFPVVNPSLKKTPEYFFDDYVTKKYDHDYLHKLVAFYDKPLYETLQTDSKIVWCDVDLWNKLSYNDKLKCVAEETYVIAIERFLVPNDWKFSKKLAYYKSLCKVSTTLTSGWFRDFAIDNFSGIMNLFSETKFNDVRITLNV